MIGLDSNILIRYLTSDDPAQSPKAVALIEQQLTMGNPGFISNVALAETVWTLKRFYRFSDGAIALAVERILRIEALIVQNEPQVFAAMIALKNGLGEFGDALIEALGAKAGCTHTLTFDRGTSRLPGFELL
jgi:predicted nucleic-acid-binding protein